MPATSSSSARSSTACRSSRRCSARPTRARSGSSCARPWPSPSSSRRWRRCSAPSSSPAASAGPVVPPMPWIDLVLPVPLDRALALRRWWRYAAVGGLFVGALSGLTIGAGLAFAHLAGPVTIIVTTVVGTALGVLATRLWLWSQVRSWPGPDRGLSLLWRVPDALRELHAESLRAHSANTSTMAGLGPHRQPPHGAARPDPARPSRPLGPPAPRPPVRRARAPRRPRPAAHAGRVPLGPRAHRSSAARSSRGPSRSRRPRASRRRSACCRSTSASAPGRRGCACRPTTSAPRRCSAPARSTEAVAHVTVPTALTRPRPRRLGRRRGGPRLAAGQRAAVAVARPRARRRGQRAGGVPRLPHVHAAAPDGRSPGMPCRPSPSSCSARSSRC